MKVGCLFFYLRYQDFGGFRVLDYLIAAALGLFAGFAFLKLAIIQIAKRTEGTRKKESLQKPLIMVLWMLLSAVLFATVVWRESDLLVRIEYAIYISVFLNIAVVDFLIRKIPNELLLVLLVTKTVFLAIGLFSGVAFKEVVFQPLIGLAVGFLVFSIPSFLKLNIGAGDIKLAGIIGFCLGFYLFFQSMVIMAGILLIYLVFLLVAKKGNLKTATAMGPYLAFGAVLTMLFPIVETLVK